MDKFMQYIWKELLKNYDVYIIILISLSLSILGILGTVSVTIVLSGTLATLATIAFSMLKNRQTGDSIEKTLEQAINIQQDISAKQFFKEWDETLFKQRLETASELSLLAHANHDLISRHEKQLKEFLQRGGKIRYILLDPEGDAMKLFATPSGGVEIALARLCLQMMNNLGVETMPTMVEIKLINHLPAALVTMLDGQGENGTIFVTLNGFNQFYLSRPHFILHKNRDGKIFEFYQNYFENLWIGETSKPFKSSN